MDPRTQKSAAIATATPVSSGAVAMENAKLLELFASSNEAYLKRNPLDALFRGDMRYADQLGDYISDAYYEGELAAANADLAALANIDRSLLTPTNAIAADVFAFEKKEAVTTHSPQIRALSAVRPIDHFTGLHTFYPTFASGQGVAPFKTLDDYENNLKRHDDYIRYIGASIDRFRQGLASGVVDTKLTIENVIAQLDDQLAMPTDNSPYMGPVHMFPESFTEAQKADLTTRYLTKTEDIYTANRNLRDFLAGTYLPKARSGVGLMHMKGGKAYYQMLVEQRTTLPLAPEDVHTLGLSEVKRIRGEMLAIKNQVGFDGDLQDFFTYVRTDEQFHPQSREWMTAEFQRIGAEVDEKVPALFDHLPKAPLDIRPYEPFREKYEAGGSYQSGTADGSRPGIFWFNAYDLASRSNTGMTTLYLHEGAPGHHFQISLAQENSELPDFMRYGGNTAYVEGWALYAETLGSEIGLYDNPYQLFGHLDDEMLRAMRLVVDTGLHAKGWTREQAIQYMLDNSSMGESDATAEVERYIAMPGQALAYKIGALTIQRLRKKAETQLGANFDVRDFHDLILGTGALPMTVLEAKTDSWIAARKSAK